MYGLNSVLHLLRKTTSKTLSTEGRALDMASGIACWFMTINFLFGASVHHVQNHGTINAEFWAWSLFILGTCQLFYTGAAQRITFNLLASVVWLHLAIEAYIFYGGMWNFTTALALPYCLFCFYSYGFLVGSHMFTEKTSRESLDKGGDDVNRTH